MAKVRNSRAARSALLCCTSALALAIPLVAQAQDGAPSATSEVTITGTRVRGTAPVGSAVTAVDRDQIELSTNVTIDRLLQEIPQVYDLGVSENSRGQAGGNGNIVYGNSVNLRGIGPYATLVLVDGRRVVNNSRSVDPSILPTLGVQRIEVVADGASAIYGSDAIAGVVNVIPRRNLDGAEVLGRYGFSEKDGFDEWQVGAAFGKVWDRGQFMVAYEHIDRSNLSGNDRKFFTSDQRAFGGADYRVTQCNPGTITLADNTTYAIPAGGLTQANAGSLVAGTTNLCNDLVGQDLFPSQKYDTLNSTFTFDVTDRFRIVADGFYSKRSFVRNPGFPSATLNVPNTNAFFVTPPGFTDTSYRIGYNFMKDLPRNTSSGSAKNWQITPGIEVDLPYGWQAKASLSYGKNDDQSNSYSGINNGALNAALASSDPALAFDPYGLQRTSPSVLDAIANQIFIAPTLNRFVGYQASANGPLFHIPGGDIELAVGYEGQRIKTQLGLARGAPDTPVSFRDFSRHVDSVYAELLVPIVGSDNAMTGIQKLDLNVAIRYDSYSDVGHTTNPKFGVSWMPTPDITLRGSYGTSFRAPLISQIYGNSNAIYGQNYQDPNGGPPILGFAQSGPNLNLGPETATTWSMGADWEPANDFKLSATYFSVNYKNQVETYLSDLSILSRESEFAGTGIILRGQDAADRVTQLIADGLRVVGALPGGDPANVTLYVDGRNNNLGRSITRGIDFNATYRLDADDMGVFTFNAGGTYLTSYKVAISATAPLVDHLNEIYKPLRFRARASVVWEKGPLRARILAHYVGSYKNTAITPSEKVSAYTPIDFSLFWHVGDLNSSDFFKSGATIGLEIQNVFDSGPPYVNVAPSGNGGGGYDPSAASPIGRLFAVSVRKRF